MVLRVSIAAAIRLVSGALGAFSFDQLLPGTVVADEFGHLYGTVVGRYVSPDPAFGPVIDDNLLVLVQIDPAHREYQYADSDDHQMLISGRYLEPLFHGPLPVLDGYRLLLKLVDPHGETTWAERHRP